MADDNDDGVDHRCGKVWVMKSGTCMYGVLQYIHTLHTYIPVRFLSFVKLEKPSAGKGVSINRLKPEQPEEIQYVPGSDSAGRVVPGWIVFWSGSGSVSPPTLCAGDSAGGPLSTSSQL